MMNLTDWKVRWGMTDMAMRELKEVLAGNDHAPPPADPTTLTSESRVQSIVRLEAPKYGYWLTRNNVGAFMNPESGQLIRYGLANETKQQNQVIKSGDLIGFRKRVILPSDVGTTIAQFASREIKHEGWTYRGTKREVAQAAWRDFVNLNGGDAAFASGPGSFNL